MAGFPCISKVKNLGEDAARSARASAHPRQLLQRAQLVVRLLAEYLRPVSVGDLGHVDIATGIDRDAVRGDKLPGPLAYGLRSEPRQHFALCRQERDPRPEIWHACG